MEKILLIGGEGTALNVADALCDAIENHDYRARFVGFVNDEFPQRDAIGEYPIVGSLADLPSLLDSGDMKVIFQMFHPEKMLNRHQLLKSLAISARYFTNFIHPASFLSRSVRMGIGNVVLPHTTILNHVVLGDNNIIGSNVVIEHETKCGASNFITAGVVVGSKVSIGDYCFIGLNSSIKERSVVADGVFLGMGSNLLRDTNPNETWYGNPARPISTREPAS